MEIFAAPEFRTAQSDYGQTASKVLAYLASFDGVPTETAVHILNDDLLMGRLEDAAASDREFGELIESAVIEENAALTGRLSEQTSQLSAEEALRTASAAASEERKSREAAEVLAKQIQEAADTAAAQAVQQLQSLEQQKSAQAAARQAADDRAKSEARTKTELETELTREKPSPRGGGNRKRSGGTLEPRPPSRRWALVLGLHCGRPRRPEFGSAGTPFSTTATTSGCRP